MKSDKDCVQTLSLNILLAGSEGDEQYVFFFYLIPITNYMSSCSPTAPSVFTGRSDTIFKDAYHTGLPMKEEKRGTLSGAQPLEGGGHEGQQ